MSPTGRPTLTLIRNDHPTLGCWAGPGLDALIRRAADEVRTCREVIEEAGPESADLEACTERLGELSNSIDQATMTLTFLELSPGNPLTRTRHLHPVGDDTA
jgi:hypothetical protein